jgi:hypothetical protein
MLQFFGGHITSRNVWRPVSLGVSSDLHLGSLKDNVDNNSPHMLEQLNQNAETFAASSLKI